MVQFDKFASRAKSVEGMATLFDQPAFDFAAVAATGKVLEFHKRKWDLRAEFAACRALWMSAEVRPDSCLLGRL